MSQPTTPDAGLGTNQTIADVLANPPADVQLDPSVQPGDDIPLDFEDDGFTPSTVTSPSTVEPAPSTVTPPADPAPAPEPEPTPDPEPSFETPLEPEDLTQQPAQAQPTPDPAPAQARPYNEYPPELVPLLKHLPNKTFAEYAPKLKAAWEANQQLDELRKQQPAYHYEHPESYQLQPEFQKLRQVASEAQFEESHWTQQLSRIKQGQSWKYLEGYDKNNRPVFREVAAPEDGTVDANSEVEVLRLMQEAQSGRLSVSRQLNQYVVQHRTMAQSAAAELAEIKQKFFPTMNPAQFTGDDKRNYELARSITPRPLQSHPLAEMNHLAFVAVTRLQRAYAKLAKEYQELKAGKMPARPVPSTPSPAAAPGGLPVASEEEIPLYPDDE